MKRTPILLAIVATLAVALPVLAVPGPEPGGRDIEISFRDPATRKFIDFVEFDTATGWDGGGRLAYRCAWVEHFTSGGLDFSVNFLRTDYAAVINDDGITDTGPGNSCAVPEQQATFDGSDHFPHGTSLVFYRGGVEFDRIDLDRGCARGYWTPGDEPGEAWLWWDDDGPQDLTVEGDGLCDGGPGEPVAVARATVQDVAPGLAVCTLDRNEGDLCDGLPTTTPPPTTTTPPFELECFSGELASEVDGHVEPFRVCTA